MIYIKFHNKSYNETDNLSLIDRVVVYFLNKICHIPKANPDFDGLYGQVIIWYIEYDEENDYTNREVGLDKNGEVIVKAPFKKNLGLWVDEDLTLKDYSDNFEIQPVDEKEFEELWNQKISGDGSP